MDMQSREERLVQIMSAGFERAARSFSSLVNKKVKVTRCKATVLHATEARTPLSEESALLYVLVTQIIGTISGKSFLIFSQAESEEIFSAINLPRSNEALNEAFLMEIDNIISASVIAELANALSLEVYGDVPVLVRIPAPDLNAFVTKEIGNDKHASVILCSTTFQFDQHDTIHPQFVWSLSNRIFETILV
jgi:chemotaxis protein CheY-P-specific phosphatase CheC